MQMRFVVAADARLVGFAVLPVRVETASEETSREIVRVKAEVFHSRRRLAVDDINNRLPGKIKDVQSSLARNDSTKRRCEFVRRLRSGAFDTGRIDSSGDGVSIDLGGVVLYGESLIFYIDGDIEDPTELVNGFLDERDFRLAADPGSFKGGA